MGFGRYKISGNVSRTKTTDTPQFTLQNSEMSAGKVIVYGGTGALGTDLVRLLKKKGYNVYNVSRSKNGEADGNITIDDRKRWQYTEVDLHELTFLLNSEKVDAVLCVAGGYMEGDATDHDFVPTTVEMLDQSLGTSIMAVTIASYYLKQGGLFQLTGSAAALGATPKAIGYGIAKAAVHQLVTSLAGEGSGMPSGATVVGIVPESLDTPSNRQTVLDGDPSKWTPVPFVSELLFKWISDPSSRPESGSLMKISTENGVSSVIKI